MKAEHKYEIDEEVLTALGVTEKAVREMEPEDRLAYFEDIANILTDIMRQCKHIGGVLSREDIMVGMTVKQYKFLFDEVREVDLELLSIAKDFTKKVPSLREEDKKERHPAPSRLIS